MTTKLQGIPETLLIPLWARAAETRMAQPIVRDPRAVQMIEQIDYDFSKYAKARMTQLGVAVRTELLDRAVQQFIDEHPSGCVVNLGAGLDTRCERLERRNTLWYDLDLPEAIELRRRFFSDSETYRMIQGSVFDAQWRDVIGEAISSTNGAQARPLCFVAEGLFMYFHEWELRGLMRELAARFAGAEMFVEVQGPAIVGSGKHHDSLSKMDKPPEFKWGCADGKTLESWHPGIKLVQQWSFFDYHQDRAGWWKWLLYIGPLRRKIEPHIVHLRFVQDDS